MNVRNATVKGVFDLDNSYFYGAIRKETKGQENIIAIGEKFLTTIDLQSLNAEGGMFANRVIVFGQIIAQWAIIGRVMRAHGLQVYFRGGVDKSMGLLDFSYMQIDGPLDLRGYVPLKPAFGELQRTVIGGDAVMRGLRAYDIQLNGLHIGGDLNLESCRIASSLTMSILPFYDRNKQECFWRSRVNGEFNASQAQIGMIEICGCSIGRSLTFVSLQLDDSLFARLAGNFRTRISGKIDLSGAMTVGDIDLSGAQIMGKFYFITGKCNRLLMSVGSWVEQSGEATEPKFCSTEAHGVLLQDLQIGAGITLTGIQLLPNDSSGNSDFTYAEGSFIAHGVRSGGGLRFWREDSRERLLAGFDLSLSEKAKESIEGIKASIGGTLDLRGIRTGDSLNLGRCHVKGDILLENAQIDGNLRAYIKTEVTVCQAQNFNADLAHINGDADLRGLRLQGDLNAHELQVSGNVLLAFPESSKEAQCTQIAVKIDLEGMHAARLMLSSMNLCAQNDQPKAARIILARCNIGQLGIRGFGKSETGVTFPHYVDLRAIQVGDWDIKPNGEVQALLEKTQPFDAGNYIDIEHKLARIGEKRWADEVYRAMKNRSSHDHDVQSGDSPTFLDRRGNVLDRFNRLVLWFRLDRWLDWLNKLFSDHGTRPARMVLWLIFWMIPVIVVLADSRNVEFVRTVDGKGQVSGVPLSNDKKYDLGVHWDWRKAIGLSMSYAIPFYGSRPDVVRARLNGGVCFLWTPENCSCNENALSPHEFAMIFSMIQFILWIMIAANLPTILRRRS
ncbi:MAG: hypothetical protein E6Q62_01130 [Nitrosomonas sp.]|nr:MAG: hypothetical protein E6Q62_01130 [Nitrosomonas sp.]